MTPSRPYLLRAIYEWIIDNGLTPMLGVQEPGEDEGGTMSQERTVIYNLSPDAVRDLLIDDQGVSFVARFQGVSREVVLPHEQITRIFCRENEQGLMFSPFEPGSPEGPAPDRPKGEPHLKIVK